MAKQQINPNTVLIIGGVGLGIFILYKPIKALFDTFGITESKTSKEVQELQTAGNKSPFSPLYWKSIRNAKLMPRAQAEAKVKYIYDSLGFFGDNFAKILAIFKTLSYKTQVSFLAQVWQEKHKVDLLEALKEGKSKLFWNGLSEKELQTIIDLVNKLK